MPAPPSESGPGDVLVGLGCRRRRGSSVGGPPEFDTKPLPLVRSSAHDQPARRVVQPRNMSGWFEVRIDGPKRHHYRLFACSTTKRRGRISPCWWWSPAGTSRFGRRSATRTNWLYVRWARSIGAATRARSSDVTPALWSGSASCGDAARDWLGRQYDRPGAAR